MHIKSIISLLAIITITTGKLFGCPTCVGRIRLADEPFFAEKFRNTIIHNEEDQMAYQLLQKEYLTDGDEDEA